MTDFRLNEFLKNIDSVVIISRTDLHGTITYANKHFEKISGYSKEELLGKSHNIVRSPKIKKKVFKNLWKTITKGEVWQGTLENRAKDGSKYYVKSHIFPIFNTEHKIVEYMAIREDVTDVIKSKKAYINQLKFSNMLLNNTENIIIVTKNNKLDQANEAFYRTFGYYNLESFKTLHNCVCELFIEKEGCLKKEKEPKIWYDPILQEPNKVHLAIMQDSNNDRRTYNVKSRKVIYDKNTIYIINTFNDITELEQAKQKAQESESMQTMFLANMSHEIRTPMNGILGFTQLLQETTLSDTQKKYVNILDSATNTLLNIINDILDSSKIANNKIELETVEINPFIEFTTTYELLKSLAEQKSLHYKIDLDKDMFECIQSDSTRLRQIITNLLSNAIKFTPENGHVCFKTEVIKIEKLQQKVRFSISDTGIGIAEEKLTTIFQPFSQADNSTTRKFGGTGLGLSISSDLVKLFGGDLKVESTQKKGTTFFFDLELHKCKNSEYLPQLQNIKEYEITNKNLNILIAEDYNINRMLMEALLNKYPNIKYEFAHDGKEAVEKFTKSSYDMVLMDVNMPNMNGIDATQIIRQKEKKHIPIIALTANALKGDREKFLEAGMDDYIAKPVNIKELKRVLAQYTSKIEIPETKQKEEKKAPFNCDALFATIKSDLELDDSTIKEILTAFIQNLRSSTKEIENAFKTDDKEYLLNLAHRLKGSSLTLSLTQISQIMEEIEKNIKNNIESDYTYMLKTINDYINFLEGCLDPHK